MASHSRAHSILVSLSLSVSGCYLAHERTPDGAVAPMPDATVPDAPVPDAPMPDAPVPDAFVHPCAWQALPAWQLTRPPGDQALSDLAAVPGGDFVIAWGSSNDPPPDPIRHAQHIGLDGPLGERTDVFDAASGFFVGGVGLAVGPTTLLATTWDEAGCHVRLLDREGAPIGRTQRLRLPSCVGAHAVRDGFALFDRPGDAPAALHGLDPSGALVWSSPAIAAIDGAFWWARARMPDATSLVVGMHDGVEPTEATVQHLGEAGELLGAPIALPSFRAASRVRAIALGDGALVAWLEQPDGDPTSQDRDVRAFRVDASGQPLEAPRTLAVHAYRDAGLSLARANEGVAVVFVESRERLGIETTLVAQVLDASAAPVSRIELASGQFARSPLARTGDAGIAIAFTAPGPGATQVFVTGLVCR